MSKKSFYRKEFNAYNQMIKEYSPSLIVVVKSIKALEIDLNRLMPLKQLNPATNHSKLPIKMYNCNLTEKKPKYILYK